ncbi:MAG: hypothetical protein K0B05_06810 [Bacteroidales bacterium]|nr:hypothetical protein [Bacteroidales bacterium]
MKYIKTPGIESILTLALACALLSGCIKTEDALDPEIFKAWEYFDINNGPGDDYILSLFEDKKGNIWAGTQNNGVSKFDGHSWTNYNVADGLPDNSVLCIEQDGYGNMWFGTLAGLSILAGNEWTNFADFGGVFALLKDHDDHMWLSTTNYAVLEYTNNDLYQYYDNECEWCNVVDVLFEDIERNIWIGTWQDLKKITRNTVTSYTASDGLPGGAITAMHQDIWGNIWIGTILSAYVTRYNNGSFELVNLPSGISINSVNSIASDNNGNVWFGLSVMGALRYNGSFMRSYSVKDGLPGRSVTKIIRDRNGYLWFGTMEGGVARYLPLQD